MADNIELILGKLKKWYQSKNEQDAQTVTSNLGI